MVTQTHIFPELGGKHDSENKLASVYNQVWVCDSLWLRIWWPITLIIVLPGPQWLYCEHDFLCVSRAHVFSGQRAPQLLQDYASQKHHIRGQRLPL